MSVFTVDPRDQDRLVGQPETGMGFQVVWADLVGGKPGRYVILDSAVVLPARSRPELRASLAQLRESAQDDIENLDFPPAKFQGNVLATTESRLPNSEHDGWPAVQFVDDSRRPLFNRTALVVSRTSSLPEAFIRYSARRKDPRVDSKTGDFAPGTYAAPWSEAPLVPSGFAAVARYALPNPFAARRVILNRDELDAPADRRSRSKLRAGRRWSRSAVSEGCESDVRYASPHRRILSWGGRRAANAGRVSNRAAGSNTPRASGRSCAGRMVTDVDAPVRLVQCSDRSACSGLNKARRT